MTTGLDAHSPTHRDDRDSAAPPTGAKGHLLLVTAVRLRQGPRGLRLDDQTCAGICRWAEHFETVTFAGIALADASEDATSATWLDVVDLPCSAQIRFVPLPLAYRVGTFVANYRQTRALLAAEIRRADHLSFTVGYLVGDWAAIAALEARSQGRKFAIWFDRVEQDVIRNALPELPLRRQIKERLTLPLMIPYHRYLLGRSSLALLQGMDTFKAYAPYASNPACVYDVHTQPSDFIETPRLDEKIDGILNGQKLRVTYVGRAAVMKGPLDWLHALASARQAGLSFEACWLGDGPLLPEMKELAEKLGISEYVALPGYVGDRATILEAMRSSHIFMFCHKTKESPRCLIEALVSGCPIVGYTGGYPEGLVQNGGGGMLSPLDDVAALGASLVHLDADRSRLAELVRNAARSGRLYDEEKLYRERAELIARHA
ncbi:glycosyltransferase [Bosea sp. 124]|uniref:glycosyltransferase n=1 Tax=Bosea sp. 124 TaxID=2135642 RepID=UPI000D36CD75|nr:glycosyltransferase [Bosea sp. 124]PTM41486.1 glycosyl transferase family 1 [Bosea sp. 124]